MKLYFVGLGVENEGFGSVQSSMEDVVALLNVSKGRSYFLRELTGGQVEVVYQSLMEEYAWRKWHVAKALARELKDAVRVALAMRNIDN